MSIQFVNQEFNESAIELSDAEKVITEGSFEDVKIIYNKSGAGPHLVPKQVKSHGMVGLRPAPALFGPEESVGF
jgi:hypothetical protein